MVTLRFLFLTILLGLVPVLAQELGPRPEVAPHIRYTPASAERDQAAIKLLKASLAGEDFLDPVGIVAPRLSHRIGKVTQGEIVPVTFHIPEVRQALRSEGFGCRGEESNRELAKLLQGLLNAEFGLRRPTPVEMEYYWALAPMDLDGSLFVCQTPEVALLCHHMGEKMFLFEDLTDLGDSYAEAFRTLAELPTSELEPDPQANHVEAVLSNGNLPDPLKDASELTSSTLILLTPEALIDRRVQATELVEYLGQLLELIKKTAQTETLERIFLQVDLRASGEPLLRLGSQPEMTEQATAGLQSELKALEAPTVAGPICVFAVECP